MFLHNLNLKINYLVGAPSSHTDEETEQAGLNDLSKVARTQQVALPFSTAVSQSLSTTVTKRTESCYL